MTAVPLNEDDVNNEIKVLNMMDSEFTNKLFTDFSNTINSILTMALKQSETDMEKVELDRLCRILRLCPVEEKFIRAKDKIWNVRQHIANKNANYFIEKDYSVMIKKDGNQSFLETLTDIVRDRFEDMNDKEQALYWEKANKLLHCVILYKKELKRLSIK